MRVRVLLLIGFAAMFGCDERNPPVPGGGGITPPGGGGGGGGGDASLSATDGRVTDGSTTDVTITGQLCLVLDPRNPLTCPTETSTGTPLDLSGITVSEVGGASTTTAADGTFTLSATGIDTVLLVASHSSLRTSATRVQISGPFNNVLLPAIEKQAWTSLVNSLSVIEAASHGTVAVYVFQGVGLAAGVEVIQPAGSISPFYDRATPFDWSQDGLTGSLGAAMMFSVPVAPAVFSVVGPGGTPTLFNLPVDIRDATTTFAFVSL